MTIQELNRNELQQMVFALDQALHSHLQWHNNLVRSLVCRLPSDKHDTMPNAHQECRFGQWYYSNASKKDLMNHIGFQSIGEAHKVMHGLARNLLLTLDTHDTIYLNDYDNFANSLERLRLEIAALKDELENLIHTRDPLTMTLNRANMLPILREQHDLVKRQANSCCLAMMDLDLFKSINDQYGHVIGDKILVALSQKIAALLRPYDKIFRYGGEEFLICLPQVDLAQCYEIVDRIRGEVAKTPIDVGLPQPITMTVSFGMAQLDANLSVEESIDRADKALYIAKSSGRNISHIWSPESNL